MSPESLAAGQALLLPELADLRALSRQVLDAHRSQDGKRLRTVCGLVCDLLEDMQLHLRDERRARFAPARLLRGDHDQARLLLADLRLHTSGFEPPRGACKAWQELWRRLAAFEEALLRQMEREERFTAASPPR